jgi:CRP-like cAMP-binding protein
VYVIELGECEVLREKDGSEEVLAILGRGDYFGEMALLSDQTRNATIRARSAVNVLIIPKHDFNKLRESVPAFGDVFSELAKRRAGAGSSSAIGTDPSRD